MVEVNDPKEPGMGGEYSSRIKPIKKEKDVGKI